VADMSEHHLEALDLSHVHCHWIGQHMKLSAVNSEMIFVPPTGVALSEQSLCLACAPEAD